MSDHQYDSLTPEEQELDFYIDRRCTLPEGQAACNEWTAAGGTCVCCPHNN